MEGRGTQELDPPQCFSARHPRQEAWARPWLPVPITLACPLYGSAPTQVQGSERMRLTRPQGCSQTWVI